MLVRFVSADLSGIILYVGFQDGEDSGREATGGGVTSLWALLGRWCLSPVRGTPRIRPRHVFSACCSEGSAPAWTSQRCTLRALSPTPCPSVRPPPAIPSLLHAGRVRGALWTDQEKPPVLHWEIPRLANTAGGARCQRGSR